jgi:phosphohistidine phosphatase
MDLILWRHAEAADGAPDAKRPLTPRGGKQAKKVARWLRKRLTDEVRIIVSPALRCQQTAAALGLKFETSKLIGTSAGVDTLLKAAGWPDAEGAVVLVGHQPTLGQAAAVLLAGREENWTLRKGAVWWFEGGSRDGNVEATLRAVIGADLA